MAKVKIITPEEVASLRRRAAGDFRPREGETWPASEGPATDSNGPLLHEAHWNAAKEGAERELSNPPPPPKVRYLTPEREERAQRDLQNADAAFQWASCTIDSSGRRRQAAPLGRGILARHGGVGTRHARQQRILG